MVNIPPIKMVKTGGWFIIDLPILLFLVFHLTEWVAYIPNYELPTYWLGKTIYIYICTGWWFQPLWKIWKSVKIIIPNICENKKCSKPPTSIIYNHHSGSTKVLMHHNTLVNRDYPWAIKHALGNLRIEWWFIGVAYGWANLPSKWGLPYFSLIILGYICYTRL